MPGLLHIGCRVPGACCPNRSERGSHPPSRDPSSRAPVLRAERRRPNAEVRSAKCEVRVVRMARAVSDRTLAGRRMHGGLVPRKGAKGRQAAAHKEFLCGVAYLAALREIRLPRPHFQGGQGSTEKKPRPTGQHALRFHGSRSPGRTAKAQRRSAKCEGRRRVVRMAGAVSDRMLAGRRMHGGLVPRNGAKKDAKPPATKNLLAALRTWRLRVRSGCRDLTPVGAGLDRKETKTHGATRPQVSRLPFQVPRSRSPVLRARRGAPHFVRVLKYGAASRPPVLPLSRAPVLRAERRRPNAEVRSAKCLVHEWQGLCRIGRWQAGECTAGWFHATAQRRTPSRQPQRISLRLGVLGGFA